MFSPAAKLLLINQTLSIAISAESWKESGTSFKILTFIHCSFADLTPYLFSGLALKKKKMLKETFPLLFIYF